MSSGAELHVLARPDSSGLFRGALLLAERGAKKTIKIGIGQVHALINWLLHKRTSNAKPAGSRNPREPSHETNGLRIREPFFCVPAYPRFCYWNKAKFFFQ